MTIIGKTLAIRGELTSQEDVTIHGTVEGKITMQAGALLVSPTATVQAEAQVGDVKIQGTFAGDLAASQRVELVNTAQVTGTLLGPSVVMHDGAVFNGMIEVSRREGASRARSGVSA
jgi:cytoskeletal protein CcmA (bactofilin family)